MKERPILFSGEMVRAILAGRKTQTRRIVKPQPAVILNENGVFLKYSEGTDAAAKWRLCPYGSAGDQLRVKESAWMWCEKRPNGITAGGRAKWHYVPLEAAPVYYCSDHGPKPTIDVVHPETGNAWVWRLKIGRFLPKWAARITLEITAVRVERLSAISDEDAVAEGCAGWYAPCHPDQGSTNGRTPAMEYRELWERINGDESWALNPYVWILEFRRITP